MLGDMISSLKIVFIIIHQSVYSFDCLCVSVYFCAGLYFTPLFCLYFQTDHTTKLCVISSSLNLTWTWNANLVDTSNYNNISFSLVCTNRLLSNLTSKYLDTYSSIFLYHKWMSMANMSLSVCLYLYCYYFLCFVWDLNCSLLAPCCVNVRFYCPLFSNAFIFFENKLRDLSLLFVSYFSINHMPVTLVIVMFLVGASVFYHLFDVFYAFTVGNYTKLSFAFLFDSQLFLFFLF